jgi:hypothetical protein
MFDPPDLVDSLNKLLESTENLNIPLSEPTKANVAKLRSFVSGMQVLLLRERKREREREEELLRLDLSVRARACRRRSSTTIHPRLWRCSRSSERTRGCGRQ